MKKIIPFITLLIFAACNNDEQYKAPAAFMMGESLFAFHDIKNSLFIKCNGTFNDRTKNIQFVTLDTNQMRRFVAPVMKDIANADYITRNMTGHFISKQKDINGFTPITVFVNGDDYHALIYILIDKNNQPVSHVVLNGGPYAGPWDVNDTLQASSPIKHSFLEGDKIRSYELKIYNRYSNLKGPAIIDSFNYQSIIKPDGTIETKAIDSIRYSRIVDWNTL